MDEMRTFTVGGNTWEIVDGAAREQVEAVSNELAFLIDFEEVTLNPVSGYYATYNGWKVSNDAFYVTDAITLNKGDKVRIYLEGYLTNVAILSMVGNKTETNKPYTPIVVGIDSTPRWYEYTVETSGEYVISGNNNTIPQLEKTHIPTMEDVDEISKAAGIDAINPAPIVGSYATYDGWKVSNGAFYVTETFELVAGDYVSVYAQGYHTRVAILARINNPENENRPYTCVIQCEDGTPKWYRAKVTESGTYVVSGHKDTLPVIKVAKAGEIIEQIPYCDFSVFRKFGVVGDSFASGELYYNNKYVDNYSISWGQVLARMCGNVCTNYSKGGLTTRTWLTDSQGLALMNSSNADDLYILALGINDYYHLGADYLGTLEDITGHSSYSDYSDTFYGNYGKIIEQIQAHAPHAKIIMLTCVDTGETAMLFNNAIENIADHYGLPCIVQYEDAFFLSPVYTNMSGGHPRAVAYSGMAATFKRLIEKIMVNNISYFNDMYMYDNA